MEPFHISGPHGIVLLMWRSSRIVVSLLLASLAGPTVGADGISIVQATILEDDLDGYNVAYVARNQTERRFQVTSVECAAYGNDNRLIDVFHDAITSFPPLSTVAGKARSNAKIAAKPARIECDARPLY
jgi:hypothetical protein